MHQRIGDDTETRGPMMASLQQAVSDKFLNTLINDQTFDRTKIDKFEALIKEGKKIKPDDLVAIFKLPEGGEIE